MEVFLDGMFSTLPRSSFQKPLHLGKCYVLSTLDREQEHTSPALIYFSCMTL